MIDAILDVRIYLPHLNGQSKIIWKENQMKRFLAMLVAVLMALSLVTIPVTAEKDPEPEAVFTAGSATAETSTSIPPGTEISSEGETDFRSLIL